MFCPRTNEVPISFIIVKENMKNSVKKQDNSLLKKVLLFFVFLCVFFKKENNWLMPRKTDCQRYHQRQKNVKRVVSQTCLSYFELVAR